jgi:hypothetical protein
VVSMLAIGSKVAGSNPAQDDGFKGDKIRAVGPMSQIFGM